MQKVITNLMLLLCIMNKMCIVTIRVLNQQCTKICRYRNMNADFVHTTT